MTERTRFSIPRLFAIGTWLPLGATIAACAAQVSTGPVDGGSPSSSSSTTHDAAFGLGDAITSSHDAIVIGLPDGAAPADADAADVHTIDAKAPTPDAKAKEAGFDAGTDTGSGGCTMTSECPSGQTCTGGTCTACSPTTCAAEDVSCGNISDGCGQTLACDSCVSPMTCGGGGTPSSCGCTPTTCAAASATCGSISNGCGATLSCGSCTTPDTCVSGSCAAPCGTLDGGSTLASGQHLVSCDGRFSLDMQSTDGNLVVYFGSQSLWQSNTAGNAGDHASMQTDGNFVVYTPTPVALWQSGTSGNPGAYLVMQTDGNLVVYSATHTALWSSGTGGH